MPGTHVPYLYTAGTYYQADFRPDFWTVRDPDRAIVIQCREGAAYDEIIVEVEDPEGTVTMIRRALEESAEFPHPGPAPAPRTSTKSGLPTVAPKARRWDHSCPARPLR